MTKIIGKIAATEKIPTTIDEFFFWTDKKRILHPLALLDSVIRPSNTGAKYDEPRRNIKPDY